MRQTRNLTTVLGSLAALTAVTALASCSDDAVPAQPDAAATEGTPDPTAGAANVDYTIVDESHLEGPGRWALPAVGGPEARLAVVDVPAGFQGEEIWVWTDTRGPRSFANLTYWKPSRVPVDPCDADASSPELGPGVEDLAAALDAQKRTTTTDPVPVRLDGHRGVYLELSTPRRFDYASCGSDGMLIWQTGDPSQSRDLSEPVTDRYWILDVDGQRVVVAMLTEPKAAPKTVGIVNGIVEAVRFVEPS